MNPFYLRDRANEMRRKPLGIVHPLMNIKPFEEKKAERSPFLWAGHNSKQKKRDASQQAAQKEE